MAENGREFLEQSKSQVDKDTRLRTLKDRQNEERQRKLEEIKAQAYAAQRFKEQKEQERRRRLEDLRLKDDAKRHQVEERKKAINEAERDRLEFIIRRNQEREHRLDSKKRNERSSAVFAFGSSTPRMLEPSDMTVSYWGHRRATSIQNITCSSNSTTSLTRRQSERDFDVGNKKRATSATGLERTGEGTVPVVPAGCASGYTGRRRTDLIPTIPSRESSIHSSRKSLNHSPGRAYSMTRLDQLAKPRRRPDLPSLAEANPFDSRPLSSSSRVSSITRSMSHLAVSKSGQAQPIRRNLSNADSRSLHQLAGDGAFFVPRTTRTSQLREQKLHASANCSEASSRPSSSLSQQSTNSVTSSASVRHRLTATPRKPRPASIAVTGVTQDNKPPLPRTRKSLSKSGSITERGTLKNKAKSPVDSVPKTNKNTVVQSTESKDETQGKPPDTAPQQKPEEENHVHPAETVPAPSLNLKEDSNKENVPENEKSDIELVSESKAVNKVETVEEMKTIVELEKMSLEDEKQDLSKDVAEETVKNPKVETAKESKREEIKERAVDSPKTNKSSEFSKDPVTEQSNNTDNTENNSNNLMTASMIKVRINTEEEAKAALAEKRRLIREETERQAELERLRVEEEAKAELERQQREEEQVRQLIELRRQAEQERLQEAIKEAQKREEEERLKREEEQRLKLLKEESEKKAKEDAERQKAELQERLKNEEKEREARRKRVEAIMLRTRGKNNANSPSQQSTEDKNENKSEEENKDVEESKVNGTKIVEQQENGTTKSTKGEEIVDNIIPNEIVKNANTVTIDTMNTSDSINSNNSWRDSQQYGNFVINNNS